MLAKGRGATMLGRERIAAASECAGAQKGDGMTEFLTRRALSERIQEIIRGGNARCAVAFLGKGAAEFLSGGGGVATPKIICDISMGCTSPHELEALGAPDAPSLKHVKGLHAKVYISDRGLIVGSANVSDNGIGFEIEHEARFVEAGIFHSPDTSVWREASDWFDELYGGAEPLSAEALESARASWRVGPRGGGRALRAGSLLDLVRAKPQHFANVGFVFTGIASTEEQRNAAREAATERLGEDAGAPFASWPADDMFCGWGAEDLAQWPRSFFEFWVPKSSAKAYAREFVYQELETGSVFATKQRRWLSKLGCPCLLSKRLGSKTQSLRGGSLRSGAA